VSHDEKRPLSSLGLFMQTLRLNHIGDDNGDLPTSKSERAV